VFLSPRCAVITAKPDEEAIFNAARRIAAPDARRRYVEQACGEDPNLRARIEALLRVHDQERSFLEPPTSWFPVGAEDPVCEGPGTVIGPYQLLEPLGEGGMGAVFLAEQHLLSGYKGMKQREDKIPAQVRFRLAEALERLVQLYDAWNKPDEAAKWRNELEAHKKAAGKAVKS